jgi:homocysteine S-methyltransferase
VIGVAVNHTAVDSDRELRRLHWKVEAGADFAITQPVFDPAQLEGFIEQAGDQLRIPLVGGIWPLLSARNAEFLANEVPGITVPTTVLRRMRRAQEKGADHARAEGVAIAREMIDTLDGMVQGIHVSAPLGRIEVALEVIGR